MNAMNDNVVDSTSQNYDNDDSESEDLTIDEFVAEDSEKPYSVAPMEVGDDNVVDSTNSEADGGEKVHVSSSGPCSPSGIEQQEFSAESPVPVNLSDKPPQSPSPPSSPVPSSAVSPDDGPSSPIPSAISPDDGPSSPTPPASPNNTTEEDPQQDINKSPPIPEDDDDDLQMHIDDDETETPNSTSTTNYSKNECEPKVEIIQNETTDETTNSEKDDNQSSIIASEDCHQDNNSREESLMEESPKIDQICSPTTRAEDSSPDSPDQEQAEELNDSTEKKVEDMDALSLDDSIGTGPKSPDEMMNGTPISLDESQSQSSPPSQVFPVTETATPPPQQKQQQNAPEIEIDEEDLEDGEIMDEEEEEKQDEDEEEVKIVTPPRVSSKDKEKTKSKEKEKSDSSDKRKKDKEDHSNLEDLDPVKRLLAEVREKDKSAKESKEKERERRRKEKKRSKKDDKEKESSSSSSKKKKRKLSDDEDDGGEEFLLVRGASPGADVEPWVEEYGHSDDRRNKRRRESEESGSSPHNRHNRRPAEEVASPARSRPVPERPKSGRPERREPKSDVICAYFMQGKCQKSSDACNFSHDAVPPRKMELCKFWMMECCAKKEKCLYLHNDFPCKFFHTGLVCRMAERCKFSHQPLSEVTKQVLLKHIETAPKEILGDFPRLSREGALNLIHKMEAKLNGQPYEEDPPEFENHNNMNHGGPPSHGGGHMDRHSSDRHGGPPDRHGHQDRHSHDRSRDNRGHFGGPPNNHHNNDNGGRGRGNSRGGQGQQQQLQQQDNNNHRGGDRRQSRWEQSQPTKDDQEKLQELMNEAGIAGFYKDTLEGVGGPPQMQGITNNQQQMFPQMQNLQPPMLPLLPQFLPHMLPQTQGLPQVNNPALASVLATLNIPSSTIVPPPNIPPFQPPPIDTPPKIATSQSQDEPNKIQETSSESANPIPENLPKMQRELFLRIQQQQLKNENKVQTQEKSEPEEQEENWYSDDEEEETSKKKEELKAEINDQISSVLNQIRQQSQQQQQTVPKESETLKTFFGDTDLRSTPSTTDFKDVDLRTNNIFKKINILPATEINASLSSHGPITYKVLIVAGLREKPDYSQVRQTLTTQAILLDPRLGPKRSNSIPAPESPTDQSSDNLSNQPLNIPDGTPVFDPRTSKGGPQQQTGNNRMIIDQPPPSSMFPDNRFVGSMPGMNMNDFSNPFNRDPRGGTNQNQVQQSQQSPNSAAAAQNLALAQNFAAAAALMQQQWPNNQPPIDPNLFMLGFPFLGQPPVTTSQTQNPGLDFNNMMSNAGMRLPLRPPFMQQQQQQQQPPPSSSWERFSQGQGQGDLSPPL